MQEPQEIKLSSVYLGRFAADDETEKVTPAVIAVSEDTLPSMALPDDKDNPPILEINNVVFLRNKNGELNGKARLTVSSFHSVSDDFPDDEGEDFDMYDLTDEEQEELVKNMLTLVEEKISNNNSQENILENQVTEIEEKTFTITVPTEIVLTLISLHFLGEVYLLLFDNENKPPRRNTTIMYSMLQIMLKFPEHDSPIMKKLINQITEVSSERGMHTVVNLATPNEHELEIAKKNRSEFFMILCGLMNGSYETIDQIIDYITKIDSFEQRVIIDSEDFLDGDEEIESMINIIEKFVLHSDNSRVLPRSMGQKEYTEFSDTLKEFKNIVNGLNENDTTFVQELENYEENFHFEDVQQLTKTEKDKSVDGILSYVFSPITKTSLPKTLIPFADDLDFAGIFTEDWNKILSEKDIIISNKTNLTLGEVLMGGLVIATIRMLRQAAYRGVSPIALLSSFLDEMVPEEEGWQLSAFASSLAQGNTNDFKHMLNSSVSQGEITETIPISFIGVTFFAFVKLITAEDWSDNMLEVALTKSPIVFDFITTYKEYYKQLFEQATSEINFDEMSESDKKNIATQAEQQIGVAVYHRSMSEITEKYPNLDEISEQIISSVLTIADINTGKKTNSSFNSEEWINVKTDYLNKVFQMNTLNFFN